MGRSLLRVAEVIARTGLPRSSIYRRMANGSFPRCIAIGPFSAAWVADEIDAWIDARISEARRLPWRAAPKRKRGRPRKAPERALPQADAEQQASK
jgi:prophage regulatory protein